MYFFNSNIPELHSPNFSRRRPRHILLQLLVGNFELRFESSRLWPSGVWFFLGYPSSSMFPFVSRVRLTCEAAIIISEALVFLD